MRYSQRQRKHTMVSRQYLKAGDRKPDHFKVGDLFVYKNGETALVTEVFDRYDGKSKYGPEWTLRLLWTPGKDGDTLYQEADGNERHGVLSLNMFNRLSYKSGPWLHPVPETINNKL